MVLIHLPDGSVKKTSPGTVEEVLIWCKLNPYEILVTRNGELLLSEDLILEEDEVTLTSIVHGG